MCNTVKTRTAKSVNLVLLTIITTGHVVFLVSELIGPGVIIGLGVRDCAGGASREAVDSHFALGGQCNLKTLQNLHRIVRVVPLCVVLSCVCVCVCVCVLSGCRTVTSS